jgi:Multiubiquitin
MENKKIEKVEADLKKAEADLKTGANKAAEGEIKEALKDLKEAEGHDKKAHFEIQIDRKIYRVESETLTGLQLRALPSPPIGQDRDLFEVVPGGTDRKIGDTDIVKMRHGLRFFSAPAQINPGAEKSTSKA